MLFNIRVASTNPQIVRKEHGSKIFYVRPKKWSYTQIYIIYKSSNIYISYIIKSNVYNTGKELLFCISIVKINIDLRKLMK